MKCKVLQVIVLSSDLASLRQGHSSPSWNYLFVPVSGLMPPSKRNGAFSSSSDCLGGISAIIYYVITANVIIDVKNKTGEKPTL
jgi:hypothetical protein